MKQASRRRDSSAHFRARAAAGKFWECLGDLAGDPDEAYEAVATVWDLADAARTPIARRRLTLLADALEDIFDRVHS